MARFVGLVVTFAALGLAGCGASRGPARLPPDVKPRIECPPNPTPRPPVTVPNERFPGVLGREDVQNGMQAVAPEVKKCSDLYSAGTTVTVKGEIGVDGGMLWAEATGQWAGTWIGYCAAKAVCGATLPTAQRSLQLTYPFQL